jgi:hypothetical protein
VNARWVKSSFSFANGNCVEVAELPGDTVGIRDSRDPGGPVLRFTRAEWAVFLSRAGRPSGWSRRPATPDTRSSSACWSLPAEAVELPVPDAAEEGVPLIRREPQDGPRGVSAVANADLAPRQARYLDAVTVGVAQRALDPVRA